MAIRAVLPAAVSLAGAELYCPSENEFQMSGGASWNGNGWDVTGGGGAHGLTSFNLLGGYVEFDMDSSGATGGMNNNFYTISPDHAYTSYNDYCDGQGPDASSPTGTYCMEMDIIEANGGCYAASTWHTWFNHDGGCDQGGCGVGYGWQSGHVKAAFGTDGWMHITVNGNEMSSYNPYPSDNARGSVHDTMASVGVAIQSTQWHGWVPGDCGDQGNNPNSHFSVKNLKVSGSVIFGPTPPTCGGPSPTPSPTPGMCSLLTGQNNNGVNLESAARTTTSAEDCCSQCSGAAGCKGYTWVHNGECWLKSELGSLTADDFVTSGTLNDQPTPSPSPTPSPTPGPTPAPTPGSGSCCFNDPTSCAAVTDPHSCTVAGDGFCGEQSHCEGDCKGLWCTFIMQSGNQTLVI